METALSRLAAVHAPIDSVKTLKYRPHIRGVYYSLLTVGLLIVSFWGIIAADLVLRGNGATAVALLLRHLVFPVILLVLTGLIFRPMNSLGVRIFSDRLEITKFRKSHVIKFDGIKRVRFSHLPFAGGWFSIESKEGETFRFTVVFEQSDQILLKIVQAVPHLVDLKKLHSYLRTAITGDLSWDRMYAQFANRKGLAIKYLYSPLALALVFLAVSALRGIPLEWVATLIMCLGLLLLNVTLGAIFKSIEELIVLRRVRKAMVGETNTWREKAYAVSFSSNQDRLSKWINVTYYLVTAFFMILGSVVMTFSYLIKH